MFTVAGEMLRMAHYFRGYFQTPWIDLFANYSLLAFGMIVAAAPIVWGFAQFRHASSSPRTDGLASLPDALAYAAGVSVGWNIIRQALSSFGFTMVAVQPIVQIGAAFVLGAVLFFIFPGPCSRWLHDITGRVRIYSWGSTLAVVLLSLYLVFEPVYHRGPNDPEIVDDVASSPPVIIILLDGLTSRDMSLYGYPISTTPNLERLTSDWTIYDSAQSPANATIAALPSVLTGRYPYTDDWSRYGEWARAGVGWESLPRRLRARGYETHFFNGGGAPSPASYHMNSDFDVVTAGLTRFPLRDRTLNRTLWLGVWGFMKAEYSWHPEAPKGISVMSAGVEAEPGYTQAEAFFRHWKEINGKDPYFAYLHLQRPHLPYIGGHFLGSILPASEGLTDAPSQERVYFMPFTGSAADQLQIDHMRARYDENIRMADEQLGGLLETLKQLGLYDDAMIVLIADHGTTFANGRIGYGSQMLSAAEHSIPLLIKYPHQKQQTRIHDLVSLIDIAPTVLDVVGARYDLGDFDGQSLLRPLPPNRTVFTRLPGDSRFAGEPTSAVLCGGWKLLSLAGDRHYFDLKSDPDEHADLWGKADSKRFEAAFQSYRKRMQQIRSGVPIERAEPLRPVYAPSGNLKSSKPDSMAGSQ